MTHRWAERCLKAHKTGQLLFGIVQGGFNPEWRRESAAYIESLDFPGQAIGGLSLGEPKEITQKMIGLTVPLLVIQQTPLSDGSRFAGRYSFCRISWYRHV